MATDLDNAIARLEAILNAGATVVVQDGQRVEYDLAAVQKRLDRLKVQRDNYRPRQTRISLRREF